MVRKIYYICKTAIMMKGQNVYPRSRSNIDYNSYGQLY
jgi:hypothetical protein